jgi:hypothetical protein
VSQPIESEKIPGPNITNIIVDTERSTPKVSATTDCFNESYLIGLRGSQPRTIRLDFFDKNSRSNSAPQTYQPNDTGTENKFFYFNETWCKNAAMPTGWEFELL